MSEEDALVGERDIEKVAAIVQENIESGSAGEIAAEADPGGRGTEGGEGIKSVKKAAIGGEVDGAAVTIGREAGEGLSGEIAGEVIPTEAAVEGAPEAGITNFEQELGGSVVGPAEGGPDGGSGGKSLPGGAGTGHPFEERAVFPLGEEAAAGLGSGEKASEAEIGEAGVQAEPGEAAVGTKPEAFVGGDGETVRVARGEGEGSDIFANEAGVVMSDQVLPSVTRIIGAPKEAAGGVGAIAITGRAVSSETGLGGAIDDGGGEGRARAGLGQRGPGVEIDRAVELAGAEADFEGSTIGGEPEGIDGTGGKAGARIENNGCADAAPIEGVLRGLGGQRKQQGPPGESGQARKAFCVKATHSFLHCNLYPQAQDRPNICRTVVRTGCFANRCRRFDDGR